ncbi:MAG: membrane dipeptidase [Herpetosiphonaceae bacterium]|nr:membrane dipeptidase [Herpetosiphonaceae bacterium]
MILNETPLIFDGHNDTLLNLYMSEPGGGRSFFERGQRGHIDLPRAREGHFGGGFFAVFVPSQPGTLVAPGSDLTITETGYEVRMAPPLELAYAQSMTISMTASLCHLEAQSSGALRIVSTVAELATCFDTGVLAAILHFEGAEAIDPELNALEVFYRAGLRSLGIVWSRPNAFGHGVPFRFPSSPDTGPGLTEAGRRLVQACNRIGIMIDLSHLNERGFWDVAELTSAPLVVTHAASHTICPSSRNLTDRQLDAIRESDGMVGLNFEVSAVRPDSFDEPDTPLDVLVRQIDYLVERLSIDRVGFGSDFDGATMPREIGDVAGVPKLVEALRKHGYDDFALRKLTHRNWLRVLGKTWR